MLRVALLCLVALAALVVWHQRRFIYTRSTSSTSSSGYHVDAHYGLPRRFSDSSQDGQLQVTYYENPIAVERYLAKKPFDILHYFPGNGRNVLDMRWHIGKIFAKCNCSIYGVDYINEHTSRNTQEKFAAAAYKHLLQSNYSPFERHWILGSSLGSAVVLQSYPHSWMFAQGIILENPFTTADELAPWPLQYITMDKWNNTEEIKRLDSRIPLLILTSEKDEIIPPGMSKSLLRSSRSIAKRQVVLSGSNHGDAPSHPDYLPAVFGFMEAVRQEDRSFFSR